MDHVRAIMLAIALCASASAQPFTQGELGWNKHRACPTPELGTLFAVLDTNLPAVLLYWDATNSSGYTLAVTGSVTLTVDLSTNSYTHTVVLGSGFTNYYSVVATNRCGSSSNSNTAIVSYAPSVGDCVSIPTPVITVSYDLGQITETVTNLLMGGPFSPYAHYLLQRSTTPDFATTISSGGGSTDGTIDSLEFNHPYDIEHTTNYVRVRGTIACPDGINSSVSAWSDTLIETW